jgi:hypothetical protein
MDNDVHMVVNLRVYRIRECFSVDGRNYSVSLVETLIKLRN